MNRQILTVMGVIYTALCFGQTDTIFTNNERLSCNVKEITPEVVKYSFPGEELSNSIYRNSVYKIVFKNGRVQTFAEVTSLREVNSVDDFENVAITQLESEVKGLFKLGVVGSKAKGTTTLANQERVKDRAYRKMKTVAAMMGANIIYLANQRTEGNKQGSKYESGQSTETNLTGIAYTNALPDFEKFVKNFPEKNHYVAVVETKLWSGASDIITSSMKSKFVMNNIKNENGLIIVNGVIDGKTKNRTFRVVSFNQNYFIVYYEDKSSSYNIKVVM